MSGQDAVTGQISQAVWGGFEDGFLFFGVGLGGEQQGGHGFGPCFGRLGGQGAELGAKGAAAGVRDRERALKEVKRFMKPPVDDVRRGVFKIGDMHPDFGHVAESIQTADAFLDANRVGGEIEQDEVVSERERAGFGPAFSADEHISGLFVFFGEPLDGLIAVRQGKPLMVESGLGA